MKRILLLLSLFIVANIQAQIPNEKLIGTWQLIKYQYADGRSASIEETPFKRLKIITWGRFTVLDFNPAGNIIMSTIYGHYQLKPSKGVGSYELAADSNVIWERISSVSREVADILEEKPYYGLKLDSNDLLHYTNVYKTKGIKETWMRVIDYRTEMLSALISKKPGDEPIKLDPGMLVILSDGQTQTEVRANAKFPHPLSIIKYTDVEEVEFIGDAEAIKMYGMRAHHGVFILTISDENFQKTREILRIQKNVQ
jgi:hypothetical protein